VPVIANDVDGAGEAITHGKNGFLTVPEDVDSMADLILRLLQDPGLCRQISEKGKVVVQSEFSLTDMISKIENLYENLLREKSVQTA
jgi:glycosyltransferase involved in cell wall biosynthesis